MFYNLNMRVVFLIYIAWLQIYTGNATKGQISNLDSTAFYTALFYHDTVFLHKITPISDSVFYAIYDTCGVFSISAFRSTLLLVTRESDHFLRITKFVNSMVDTTYAISTPFRCDSIILYNDGHLHPSYPVWYILCSSNSGLYMTHSSNHGTTFCPFDTVLTDTTVISASFITSTSQGRDIIHIIFNKKEGSTSSLYLLNGNYPNNFGAPIFIDNSIPYDAHFSVYALADTVFTVYERITTSTFPDKDLYLAVSFYGGSDWNIGTISTDTRDAMFPVIIPARETLRIYYVVKDISSTTSYINGRLVPSPYTTCLSEFLVFEGSYSKLYSDPTSSFKGMLAISTNDSAYFVYEQCSILKEKSEGQLRKKTPGIFTIDGRRIRGKPDNGIYIKDGKGVIILK